MTKVRMYHNPRCGTCRKALGILQRRGVEVELVEYLRHPPREAEWLEVVGKLDAPPMALLRQRDPLYSRLGLAGKKLGPRDVARLLAKHPQLLERPVLVCGGRAIVARPPERAEDIL